VQQRFNKEKPEYLKKGEEDRNGAMTPQAKVPFARTQKRKRTATTAKSKRQGREIWEGKNRRTVGMSFNNTCTR